MRVLGLILFALWLSFSPVRAQENAPSDYRYQLDQYRRHYAEYQVYKTDFLNHQTLNNEQTAILAAKQAIIARELAKANFHLSLIPPLKALSLDQPIVERTISNLEKVASFHQSQSLAAQSITVKSDLTNFSLNYLKELPERNTIADAAYLNLKLAVLIRYQEEAKRAFDSILSKLKPRQDLVSVKNGLSQIETLANQINQKITALISGSDSLKTGDYNSKQFYDQSVETLTEIQSLQLKLVNLIIELDTNYVPH
ncbi:hypothetical protein HY333_02000 [Candidatus Collierbacteria bacterium]|nr:hypothetical protein [Candidatus Collierbacteria bacterium]